MSPCSLRVGACPEQSKRGVVRCYGAALPNQLVDRTLIHSDHRPDLAACGRSGARLAICRNPLSDVLRIPAQSVDHRRRHRIEKLAAKEFESRLLSHESALLPWLALRVEHRDVDPGSAGLEAGAPDD